MYAYYFIGGFFEQQSGGGRIHPSTQRHRYSFLGQMHCVSISHNMRGDEIAELVPGERGISLLAMTSGRSAAALPCPR
jgi:hypothetical protein